MKRATATVEPGNEASIRQIASASLIGSVVEWYDFFLYGTMAALVFNSEFFPKFDPLTGTLAAFTTFAAGFITRPIGGIVFGHLGDRLGRKPMLVVTMMIMGLSTFAMGLLPSYDSIGVAAPLLLVLLRMFQGLGLGGEWGGAVLLCVEHAPQERRGWSVFNGKGRCNECHLFNQTMPLFTDHKFHNIGVSAHDKNFVALARSLRGRFMAVSNPNRRMRSIP